MADKIASLAEYEAFVKDIPQELRQALLDGKPAAEIYQKYTNMAAVRVVQILATETDSAKALAAAKELLDRTYGKAVEKKEVTHSLEQLEDQELDALLLSELDDVTPKES